MATVIDGTTGVSQVQNAVVSPSKLTQPLTMATALATTSGTSADYLSIPSWVNRITMSLNAVSTNGASNPQVQLGSSAGFAVSGYNSRSVALQNAATPASTSALTGFVIYSGTSANSLSGHVVLTRVSGNLWVCSHNANTPPDVTFLGSGIVTLPGTLDRVRLTTVNGTDTFDAGSINILLEG